MLDPSAYSPTSVAVLDQDAAVLLEREATWIRAQIKAEDMTAGIAFEIAPGVFEMYLSVFDLVEAHALSQCAQCSCPVEAFLAQSSEVFEIFFASPPFLGFSDLEILFSELCSQLTASILLHDLTLAKSFLALASSTLIEMAKTAVNMEASRASHAPFLANQHFQPLGFLPDIVEPRLRDRDVMTHITQAKAKKTSMAVI